MRKDQLKRFALSGLLCLSILFGTSASFADNVTIGRYLAVAEKPQTAQTKLLQQQIQIKFPGSVLTVKQAVKFMLQFSGYHLVGVKQLNQPARAMLNQPIPEVDRTLDPMTLEQGLSTLASEPFYLLIDPVHRLVGYKIRPAYRYLYENNLFFPSQRISTIKNQKINYEE